MPERTTRQKRPVSWYLQAASGPDFLDIKSVILLAAPVSLSTSLFSWGSGSPSEIWARLLGNLFGFAAVAVLIALYRLLSIGRKGYTKARLFAVLVISAVIGFTKALVTNALAGIVLGEGFQQEIYARGFLGAVAGAVLLPITAIISATLREYGEERELLLLAAYNSKVDSLTSKKELAKLRKIRVEIDRMCQQLRLLGSEAIPSAEIALLRELVEKRVRPLSHSLYQNIEKSYPSFEVVSLLKSALRRPPPGLWVASVHAVAIPYTITLIGWQLGLIHAAVSMLLLLTLFTFGFKLTQRLDFLNPFTFMVQASTSGFLSISIANLVTGAQAIANTPLAIVGAFWYLNTAVLFAGTKHAMGVAEKNRLDLHSLRGEGEGAPMTLEKSRRDFANQLHGEVQSRMLSLVLKAQSNPGLKKDIALRELETVAELLGRKSTVEPANLQGGLEKIRRQWAGILDIDVQISEALVSSSAPDILLPAIEQAVVNASRHGLADKVTVQIDQLGERLVLMVKDNGIGPVGGKPGLGSLLFSTTALSWSLNSAPEGGSLLRLEV